MINIRKDEQAFSGIEAAIVLIAFIAVAVIFSYVLMGLGQSASDEAKDQTLAGIDTIAYAPSGVKGIDSIGRGNTIDRIEFWMYGGNSRLDMTTITMDFMTKDNTYTINPAGNTWSGIDRKYGTPMKEQWLVKEEIGNGNQLLEKGERMLVSVGLDGEGGITPNEEFTLKIMGETGPLYTISGKAPTVIDPINQISIM